MRIETRVKVKHTIRDGELMSTEYTPQYKVVYDTFWRRVLCNTHWITINCPYTVHTCSWDEVEGRVVGGNVGKDTAEQAIRDKIESFERLNGNGTVVESSYEYPRKVLPRGGLL